MSTHSTEMSDYEDDAIQNEGVSLDANASRLAMNFSSRMFAKVLPKLYDDLNFFVFDLRVTHNTEHRRNGRMVGLECSGPSSGSGLLAFSLIQSWDLVFRHLSDTALQLCDEDSVRMRREKRLDLELGLQYSQGFSNRLFESKSHGCYVLQPVFCSLCGWECKKDG
nr:hypothetical protein Iba_chr03dCG6140 [Ipomoea batatas]